MNVSSLVKTKEKRFHQASRQHFLCRLGLFFLLRPLASRRKKETEEIEIHLGRALIAAQMLFLLLPLLSLVAVDRCLTVDATSGKKTKQEEERVRRSPLCAGEV